MSYSSDEIESNVSSIVQGAPTFEKDGLGGRNVKERFNQIRELVNSVLLYEPDSVFYLIYKAVIRVRLSLTNTLSLLDDISDDLDGMAIPSRAVSDTTAFSDARTALNVISGALSRRGSISSSEYQRYERAVNRALTVFSKSARRTYKPFSGTSVTTDVVKAYAESVISLNSNYTTFKTYYQQLLSSVDDLLNAYSDYDHDEIVRSVASRQVSRIKSELETLSSNFSSSSPDKRAQTVRADTLKLLTNKASVKALSILRYPGEPKLQQLSSGSSLYRISASGTGTAPSITGNISAPWPILSTHQLKANLNGTSVTVPIVPATASAVPGIKQASITGYNSEVSGGFIISGDISTPLSLWSAVIAFPGNYAVNGTNLYLVVDGTTYTIAFGANGDAAYVAGVINTAASAHVTASAVTGGGLQKVVIAYSNGTPPTLYSARYMQIASGASDATALRNWTITGVVTSDLSAGRDANNKLIVWPNDDTSSTTVTLTSGLLSAGYKVASATLVSDISAVTGITASLSSGRIKITSDNYGEGSIVKIDANGLVGGKRSASALGADTLGFYKDQEVRETDFSGQALVDVLNSNSNFRAQASAYLVRTEIFTGKEAYGNSTDEVKITVDAFSEWSGWSFTTAKFVIDGGENRGVYSVTGLSGVTAGGLTTLTFTLNRDLRSPSEIGMRIRFYSEFVKIVSNSSSTTAIIDIDETHPTTAHSILGLSSAATRGTVTKIYVEYNDPAIGWTAANLTGLGIKVGDEILQENGTLIATITGIGSISTGILDVSPISPTVSFTAFSIKSVSFGNHNTFISSLQSWRDGLTSDEEELKSLTKAITFLLKTNNPPRGRVETAANELAAIRNELEGSSALQGILEAFTVPSLPPVDRALDVMTEQGHDRALDLLTSGKFSQYNQTNYKTASSSGAMMDSISKVAVSDLIEPTKTRQEFVGEIDKIVSTTWDEVDPKYNFSDIRADSSPIHLDYFSVDIPE